MNVWDYTLTAWGELSRDEKVAASVASPEAGPPHWFHSNYWVAQVIVAVRRGENVQPEVLGSISRVAAHALACEVLRGWNATPFSPTYHEEIKAWALNLLEPWMMVDTLLRAQAESIGGAVLEKYEQGIDDLGWR